MLKNKPHRSYVCGVKKRSIGEGCTARINFASNKTDQQPMPTQKNKLDFSNQNIYAGFDVHLKNWKVSIMVDDIHHKTFSQNPSPHQLVGYLRENFPSGNYFTAYEAGFCGFWIHQELQKLGVNSIVVNPADIPTTGKETRQKEDKRDSLKIVKSLRAGLLQPIYTPTKENLEDRALIRLRFSASKDLARAKNRIKSYLYFMGIEIPPEYQKQSKSFTRSYLKWLEELAISERSKNNLQLYIKQASQANDTKKHVNSQLKNLFESPEYCRNYQLLKTVVGIGTVSAAIFLLEIENIQRFKTLDHFCSFIGLVPSTKSSGEKEKTGGITQRRSKILRSTLTEAAWVAIRRDPVLMKKYFDLKQRMNQNRAIIRIAKSLAARILFVLKNQKPYEFRYVK